MPNEKTQEATEGKETQETTEENSQAVEKSEENPTENPNDEASPLQKAQELSKKIESGIERFESLVKKNEQILSDISMMGTAKAGQVQKTEEQKIQDKAKEEIDKTMAQYNF